MSIRMSNLITHIKPIRIIFNMASQQESIDEFYKRHFASDTFDAFGGGIFEFRDGKIKCFPSWADATEEDFLGVTINKVKCYPKEELFKATRSKWIIHSHSKNAVRLSCGQSEIRLIDEHVKHFDNKNVIKLVGSKDELINAFQPETVAVLVRGDGLYMCSEGEQPYVAMQRFNALEKFLAVKVSELYPSEA